jgi:hypothetical protein
VDPDDSTATGASSSNAEGQIRAIVEHKDASAEQLQIRELNTGLMVAPAARLREGCSAGSNNSARVLSDRRGRGAVKAGHRVDPVVRVDRGSDGGQRQAATRESGSAVQA